MKSHSFPEIVREHFGFLTMCGFSLKPGSRTKVRYESSKVHIEISRGEQDGEVAISFGRITPKEEFSFTLFLRKENPILEKQMGERLANTPEEIRECIIKLGDALQREGVEILRGNDALFEKMKEVRWWHFQRDVTDKPSAISSDTQVNVNGETEIGRGPGP
jgi:hypothetical protein